MATTIQKSKEYFRSLNIIFFSLLAGQVAFVLIVFYLSLNAQNQPSDEFLNTVFLLLSIAFGLNGILTGRLIYKGKLKKLTLQPDFVIKMSEYRGVFIIRLALMEGTTLFSIIAGLITSELIFLGITGVLIVYYLSLRPLLEKIVVDLELSSSEKGKLENPEELIAEFAAK